jgi:hypothetical protein
VRQEPADLQVRLGQRGCAQGIDVVRTGRVGVAVAVDVAEVGEDQVGVDPSTMAISASVVNWSGRGPLTGTIGAGSQR